MIKKIIVFLTIFIFFYKNAKSQSLETELTNKELNEILQTIRNDYISYQFNDYYFNSLPCSDCFGGSIDFPEKKSNLITWKYKGTSFTGQITKSFIKVNKSNIYISCRWNNIEKVGAENANINIEYYLNMKSDRWNSIIRLNVINTEMVAYLKLGLDKFEFIESFISSSQSIKKKKELDLRIKNQEIENTRKKDSILLSKKNYEDSILRVNKNYEDSVLRIKKNQEDSILFEKNRIKKYNDSLEIEKKLDTLKIGSLYEDGMVIAYDKDNRRGVICALLDEAQDITGLEAQKTVKNNQDKWRAPTKEEFEQIIELNILDFPEGVHYFSSTSSNYKSESVDRLTKERIWGGFGGRYLNNLSGNGDNEQIISGEGIWVQTLKAKRKKNKGFWLILESERKGYNKNIKINVRLVREFSNVYRTVY